MFLCGAQYYRPPNPSEGEWEKDFRTMAGLGFTIAGIRVVWGWIHREADLYDFGDIDRLFDIACRNGVKLVIRVGLEDTPYWLIHKHPEAFCITANAMEPAAPATGSPGLCLDNPQVRLHGEKFLKALASRYAGHPAHYGYDISNETGLGEKSLCYCESSRARFVEWLRKRYGDIEELNNAWHRRYSDWNDICLPRFLVSYPDWLDWLKFRLENWRDLVGWQAEALRSVDPHHPMSGTGMFALLASNFVSPWQQVDQLGLSAFPMDADQHASDLFRMLDLAQSASAKGGRKFWQSELQGGQGVCGMWRSRVVGGEDIAQWSWSSLMCGARGLMYRQWRPEPLGPESPGYGLCRLDGTPTDRAEVAGWFASFMKAHPELADAKPIRGEAAIVIIPESQLFAHVANRDADTYCRSVFGTYRALWNVNVQVDFCTLENIGDYLLAFLPFPLMLEEQRAYRLKKYVANGGVLVSYAAPGHFGNLGYCSLKVPGLGLDELFGSVESEMEYVSTLTLGDAPPPAIVWDGMRIGCSVYQEKLVPLSGTPTAWYDDGSVAIVDNRFGKGKTRLIGTCPGTTYFQTLDHEPELLIRNALDYADIHPMVEPLDTFIKARLHRGASGDFLWVLNTSYDSLSTEVTLCPEMGRYSKAENLVTGEVQAVELGIVKVSLGPLKGTVIKLS